ncbi:hypothetical protein EHS25_001576 [Saitozyma podzolica]|uniref:Uncharacterized protein n=1 Tax=Saitozyma podzolica TaxID=1890683 RepID=A0A427YGN2_9TREE|nr:hypothetical protein EHS25_001576 [Saitozyma podzolica]
MDEGLFLFAILCGFILLSAIIYCFLSTCLGLSIRRSDIWEALRPPTLSDIRTRDAARRRRAEEMTRMYGNGNGNAGVSGDYNDEGYELDHMGGGGGYEYDRGMGVGGVGGGAEELEMMRRGGRGYY